jgi:inorganic pyrophosphatase
MTNFPTLPTCADKDRVYAVVETPRGSRARFRFDPRLEVFALARSLVAGLTYPDDWGFIPSTQADDGDPLDILIIHDAATYPGLVLRCRPVGVLELVQTRNGREERTIVSCHIPTGLHCRRLCKMSRGFRRERSTSWKDSSRQPTRST